MATRGPRNRPLASRVYEKTTTALSPRGRVEVMTPSFRRPITVVRSGGTWPVTDRPIVVDAGVTSTKLGIETMDAMTAGAPDGFIDTVSGELPMFAFGYLALRAGYRWTATDDPNSEITTTTLGAKDVVVNSGVGSIAKFATGSELIAVPVTLTIALAQSILSSAAGSIRRSTVPADHVSRHLVRLRS